MRNPKRKKKKKNFKEKEFKTENGKDKRQQTVKIYVKKNNNVERNLWRYNCILLQWNVKTADK